MADAAGKSPTDEEIVDSLCKATLKLERDLAEAAANFSSDETGRRGVQNALVAVHRFLCAIKVPDASLGPITQVVFALAALDEGKVLPLTERKYIGKGHPITEADWVARALAAAALELRFQELKADGRENALDNAAAWVANEIRDWVDLKISTDPETQSKTDQGRVKRWRSQMSEKPPEDPTVELYHYFTAKERGWTAKELLERQSAVYGVQTRKS
jgi:hypothetical protein